MTIEQKHPDCHAVSRFAHPVVEMHLVSNFTYEESSIWCGAEWEDQYRHGETHNPDHANCVDCLRAVAAFAERARRRLEHIEAQR